MAQINPDKVSLSSEAKAGFVSLIQQSAIVFLGLITVLLVSGGSPPPQFVVSLSFLLGVAFVTWSEQRRIKRMRAATQINSLETSSNDSQQDISSTEGFSSEANIVPESEQTEWNALQWFKDENVPETARQKGWSLSEQEVRVKLSGLVSLIEWIINQIPSPAFSRRKRKQKILTLTKTVRVRGVNYILRIYPIEQNYWSFALETVLPGNSIPEGFELHLISSGNSLWSNMISRVSANQEKLSIEVFVAKGNRIIWNIQPRPDNYSHEILKF
jgi:hypothetical protein